jgi:UDP-N-acetylmuramate--alanine ligase
MYNPNLHFHFTGIGGVGMSGIAEILLGLGFRVSGSDLRLSPVCKRLEELGADIQIGHRAEHLPASASLLVFSSAVPEDNPELVEAKRRGLPVIRRAEVLAELMRLKFGVGVAGSHGKTTTTSLVASVMEHGELDPTVIIGGQVKSIGTGGKLGKGSYLVAESDESDRSFLLLRPTIAVVTNIDHEHMNAYGSFEDLEASFEQFISSVPFYGLAVLCIDNAVVKRMSDRYQGRKITYGFSEEAELRATDLSFDEGRTSFSVCYAGKELGEFRLNMPGRHLVANSLAAIAVGLEFGVDVERIKASLTGFGGVKRRLEVVGSSDGVTVINDYGHHPTEIRATVSAVREGWKKSMRKLHVVFQPHRYSRTKDCFAEFCSAFHGCDHLYVSDIYAAGEKPLDGVSSERLCSEITEPPETQYIADLSDVPQALRATVREGDVILCLGAGSIGGHAETLLTELQKV